MDRTLEEKFALLDQKIEEYESLNNCKISEYEKNKIWVELCLPLCGWGAYINPETGEDDGPYAGLTEEQYYALYEQDDEHFEEGMIVWQKDEL